MPSTAFHSLSSAIATWAAIWPDSPAALTPRAPDLSWKDLDGIVIRFAASLRAAGIGPQDRIVILMPPSRDAVVVTLAVAAAAVAVPLEVGSPGGELETIASVVRPALAIAAAGEAGRAAALGCPVVEVTPGPGLPIPPAPDDDRRPRPGPDDLALIACIYGEHGDLRLVPRLHRQIVTTAMALARARGLGPGDRWLNLGRPQDPLSFSPAMTSVLAGGAMVFPPSLDPSAVAFAVFQLQPTWTVASPAQFDQLVSVLDGALTDPPFRLLVSSGGRLDPALAERMGRVLAAPIIRELSMPETMEFALAPHLPGGESDASPFRPIDFAEVAVASPGGDLVAPGEPGEIVTRGPHVFPGYLHNPGLDASAFLAGGWFRTGLRGQLEGGNGFRVLGSIGGFIDRGGERIDPAEVEAVLLAHPDIAAAGVYGVPDAVLGEDARAAIVLRPDAAVTPRAIRRWMLDHLPVTKVPRRTSFLDALPESAPGVVDRALLAAAVEAADALAADAAAAAAAAAAEAAVAASPAPPAPPALEPAVAQLKADEPAAPALAPAAVHGAAGFSDPRVRGPVRLLAPVAAPGDVYPLVERFSFPVEPTLPIDRIILRGVCLDDDCIGRLVQVVAGAETTAFVVPRAGAFALSIPASLPASLPAAISFDPAPPRDRDKPGKKAGKVKGKKKARNSEPLITGPVVLPFEVSAVEFESGR